MILDGLHLESHGPEGDVPIVLVHGAPDRGSAFRSVLEHLGDRQVVVYDRRGYARSVGATPPTSMADHARDLHAILDWLGRPAVVVAHSFGSNPTMLAATFRPEGLLSVGLWEPPLVWTDDWVTSSKVYNREVAASDDPEGKVEDFYRTVLGDAVWETMSPDARQQRRAEGPAFKVDMASAVDAPFEFDDVKVPALVGYGTATTGGHAESAVWLAERLPDAGLYEILGAGHFAPRTHPAEYAAFVRAAAIPAIGAP